MKQLCVLTALLALALAEPTIYFQETFEDGKPVRSPFSRTGIGNSKPRRLRHFSRIPVRWRGMNVVSVSLERVWYVIGLPEVAGQESVY